MDIRFTIICAGIPVVLGALIMGFTDLVWLPWVFFVVGVSIALLLNWLWIASLIGLLVSGLLLLAVYLYESRFLEILLKTVFS